MASQTSTYSSSSIRSISYKRLSSRIPEIRLLEIAPTGHLERPISCRLVNVPLSEKPVFVGLSVLLGDSTIAEIILMNHSRVHIPATLAEAIRHVRTVFNDGSGPSSRHSISSSISSTPKLSRNLDVASVSSKESYSSRQPLRRLCDLVNSGKTNPPKPQPLRIWTDSLCINEDDSREAGDRAKLMQVAYRRARTVVGWLGLKHDSSEILVDTLKTIDRAMPDGFGSPKDKADHPENYSPHSSWMAGMMQPWLVADEVNQLDDCPIHEAMRNFMLRPYFQNSWIVRELAGATFPTFLLEDRIVSWAQVLRMNRATEELVNHGTDLIPDKYREQLNLFSLDTIFIFLDAFDVYCRGS
ncbi:hypothetical protein PFICI_14773 [Pestalotiopsis fici W106-1]|uniref:Heterokaryon incompatibility domain-containing protein n=1 Tax=Pestalotiopsis fici (strain W106-1 / CGMCC3.15140) TaxID=1229662 RepID=W3WL04_PESFW|nr:uncharacterized protein PFICI_14773 [Pestalotiopsis fici W106-1]ETS73827.1 hypothetical protein PFICI_14773 [Pestalotiopsis fici W106-1]